jgi:hypothetical protein
MAKEWLERIGGALDKAIGVADDAKEMAVTAYESSGVSKAVESSKGILDEMGVTERVHAAAQSLSDGLDTVSGKRILDLVEKRLEAQARYNDILATKLSEALDRLAALEARLAGLER